MRGGDVGEGSVKQSTRKSDILTLTHTFSLELRAVSSPLASSSHSHSLSHPHSPHPHTHPTHAPQDHAKARPPYRWMSHLSAFWDAVEPSGLGG